MKAAATSQGRSMDEVEAAWVAGLYEGEGTLVKKLDKRNSTTNWELTLHSIDEDVIRKLHQIAGVGRITIVRKAHPWSDQWRWRVSRRVDIAHVLGHIQGHLGKRRRARAMEFLDWFSHTTRDASRLTPDA